MQNSIKGELFQCFVDYSLEPIYTKPREGDIEKSILDNGKLISMFHFMPSIDVETGINQMINAINK